MNDITPARGNFFGGFRKRTYTFPELMRALATVWRRRADVRAIWGRNKRLDPAFREQIMVAVAQVNECRYCSFVHQAWASQAGVSDKELAQMEGLDPESFDRRTWVALAYARARAEADFGPIAAEIDRDFQDNFREQEQEDIMLVAQVMTIANRSANTLDALLSRFKRAPAAGSRAFDELLIAALVVIVIIAVTPLTMRNRGSGTPLALLREFRSFSKDFERSKR